MSSGSAPVSFFNPTGGAWQERLKFIVETMREMSRATDPAEMVRAYAETMGDIVPSDRFVALSRRELERPQVRITRSDLWQHQPNPWKEKAKLPVLEGGLLAELIWADEPRIINDLQVDPSDPAAKYFAGMRSLVAVPNFDRGMALNMVVLMRTIPDGYNPELLPEHVWMSNLFGRATHNLVLASQVREAYEDLDHELKVVADTQRSLLPTKLPGIPGVELAAHYQTSARAGGDYYDFFPLPEGKWGILIADVSGHGTPAAVLMAITHSIAHTHGGPPMPPSRLMTFVNQHLAARYTNGNGTFVTAFYGILDPQTRHLTFASAGHPPPRVRHRNGQVEAITHEAGSLPLGIDADEIYTDTSARFAPGDLILFYTDGISEARSPGGEMFDIAGIDAALARCDETARQAIDRLLDQLNAFTGGGLPSDDQTILAARVTWSADLIG